MLIAILIFLVLVVLAFWLTSSIGRDAKRLGESFADESRVNLITRRLNTESERPEDRRDYEIIRSRQKGRAIAALFGIIGFGIAALGLWATCEKIHGDRAKGPGEYVPR